MKATSYTISRKNWDETAYLLHSPVNAQRLLGSVARLKMGKGKERKIALGLFK